MKVKEIKVKDEKEFKPFSIEITFENAREARLMWHVMNKMGLRDALFADGYGSVSEYNMNIGKDFGTGDKEIRDIIENNVQIFK